VTSNSSCIGAKCVQQGPQVLSTKCHECLQINRRPCAILQKQEDLRAAAPEQQSSNTLSCLLHAWATGERHRRHHHLGTHVICYHQLQLGTHVELHQLSVGRLCTFCRTCTCIHPHLYESKEREFAAARPPNEHDGRARFRIAHAMYGRSFGPVEQRPHLFGWDRKLMTVKPRFPFLAALS
jgi:hypothetical protein